MTQRTKLQWGLAVVVLIGLGWWLITPKAVAPTVTTPALVASTTLPAAISTTAATTAVGTSAARPFVVNAADQISSWSFKGAYSGNETLIAQAGADAAHLTSLLGKGQYDDYDLHVGLGNDADMIGEGALAMSHYNKAIAIHPKKGLAYVNIGHLMDELGASHSAVDAYAKAVAVEPGQLEYHIERLNYLKDHFGGNKTLMLGALTDVSTQFGDAAPVLKIEAQWLTDQRRYADAITAWQKAKELSPGRDTSAIDTEIARLRAKL